jgi:IS5 family transposase
LDHVVITGNPPDAPMLVPAMTRVIARFAKTPTAVTADRGYGETRVDDDLEVLGVTRIAIPRRGKATMGRQQIQNARGFTKLVKWRTGCEGRVACLKRNYGWSRTLRDGQTGAASWCGWGVLAHNSVKIAALIDAKPRPTDRHRRP